MSEITSKLNKDKILETVKKMVGFMNIDCQIELRGELYDNYKEGAVVVSIQTNDNANFLIGKNGQNLKSLEHVLRAMMIKSVNSIDKSDQESTIVLDINDYRKSRVFYLIDAAKQVATRVRNTQKAEALFPMSAYERRIVHIELAAYPDIVTESVGSDPNRRVIVKPFQ